MTELIHRLIASDDNCFVGEYYDPTHRTDEIYTCLDCLDAGIRATERERIVKLLEPLGQCEPSICGKGCRGEYRCIGWAYRHAIRLIKGAD